MSTLNIWGSDSHQMGLGSGLEPLSFTYIGSRRRVGGLLCRSVTLLRVLTLRKTERQRARFEAWESGSATPSKHFRCLSTQTRRLQWGMPPAD